MGGKRTRISKKDKIVLRTIIVNGNLIVSGPHVINDYYESGEMDKTLAVISHKSKHDKLLICACVCR